MKLALLIFLIGMIQCVSGQNDIDSNGQFFGDQSGSQGINSYDQYVDLRTGRAVFPVNLGTVHGATTSVNIGFNYVGGGIKVAQEASSIGLGWEPGYSYAIKRSVIGMADETHGWNDVNRGGTFWAINYDLDCNVTDDDVEYDVELPWPSMNSSDYLVNAARGKLDLQPDEFDYNIPGHSGKFVYDFLRIKEVGEAVETMFFNDLEYKLFSFLTIPHDEIQIWTNITQGPYCTELSSILIVDPLSGMKYLFNEIVYTASIGAEGMRDHYLYGKAHMASDFYLSEVYNVNNELELEFFYDKSPDPQVTFGDDPPCYFGTPIEFPEAPIAISNPTEVHMITREEHCYQHNYDISESNGCGTSGQEFFKVTTTMAKNHLRLTSIIGKYGSVNFTYGIQRLDLPGDLELDRVTFQNSEGGRLSEFQLNHSYVTNDDSSNRLILDNIQSVSNSNQTQPYLGFEYFSDVILPNIDSYSLDFFGYYNGQNNNNLIPDPGYISNISNLIFANRQPNFEYTIAQHLKKVYFPMGGFLEFQLEPNTYGFINGEVSDVVLSGGVRVKQIVVKTKPDEAVVPTRFDYTLNGTSDHSSGNQLLTPQFSTLGKPQISGQDVSGDWYCIFSCDFAMCNRHSSNPQYEREFSRGNLFQYDNVTVRTPGQGYVEYTFSNFSIDPSSHAFPYAVIDLKSYRRGLLKRKTIYSELNEKISDESFEWDVVYLDNQVCLGIKNQMFEPLTARFKEYYYQSEVYAKTQSQKTIYSPNNPLNYQTITTQYDYHPDLHRSIRSMLYTTTDPINPLMVVKNKFLADYAGNESVHEMNEVILRSNSLGGAGRANPIESLTLKGDNLSDLKVYEGNITTYRVENNKIVTDAYYRLELDCPVAYNELFWSHIGEEGFIKNEAYERRKQILSYKDDLRPVTTRLESLPITTTLYSGASRNVVASVKSAREQEIAYTSFEGPNDNGWTYSLDRCSSSVLSWKGLELPDAATGGHCYNFALGESVVSQMIPEGSYKLTFWTKQNTTITVDLSGGNLISVFEAKANEHFNWLYNEYIIHSSESFTVNVVGNSGQSIDELRLYPLNSEISTKAYNLNGSVQSICNASGHIEYFIYDEWGRNQWVINDQGELQSFLSYHVRDEQIQTDHSWLSMVEILNKDISSEDISNQSFQEGDVSQLKAHYDGLGRTVQISQVGGSNSPNRDINFIKIYDDYGRISRSYLPYCSEMNANGGLDDSPIASILNFYNSAEYVAQTAYPFADVVFSPDATQRVKEVSNVGEDWQLGGGHTQQYEWSFTMNEQDVLLWTGTSSSFNAMDGTEPRYFPSGSLIENVTINEEGKEIIGYYDLTGKLICQRIHVLVYGTEDSGFTQSIGTGSSGDSAIPIELGNAEIKNLDTYYIYDDLGRIIYQLPPYFVMNLNGLYSVETSFGGLNYDAFDGLVDAYRYDASSRLIQHKSADAPWSDFVYDKFNRLVLARNGGDEAYKWNYSKYDILNRPIQSGVFTTSSSRSELQDNLGSAATPMWEIWNTDGELGYSNNVFPTSSTELMTEYYYDDYSFDVQGLNYEIIEQPFTNYSCRTHGMQTGQKVKVLDETGVFLTSVIYYNPLLMPLVTVESGLSDGKVKTHYNYNSRYQLESTISFIQHAGSNDHVKVCDYFEYDHVGRPKKVARKINDNELVIISELEYNRLGQLIRKRLHRTNETQFAMQVVDYRYNERGWLTRINNADLVDDGDNLESYDVFGEEILYNSDDGYNSSTLSIIPRFDGAIAGVKWKSKSNPDDYGSMMAGHSYIYRYDDFGQLTAAFYAASHDLSFDDYSFNTHFWDEKLKYDLNGNVRNILRNRGKSENGLIPGSPICVDDLNFEYYAKTNRIKSISDNAIGSWISPDAESPYHHFIDGTNSEQEYLYNARGETVYDNNKSMTYEYNHLGLLKTIHNGNQEISTTWDAHGNKLSSSSSEGVIDYLGGAEFKDGVILNVKHTEGISRCVDVTNDLWASDYFIQDHVGNVRAVITSEESEIVSEIATVEVDLRPIEDDLFDNLDTEKLKPYLYPYDPKYPDNAVVSELTNLSGKVLGPSRLTKVRAGESVDIEVSHWYNELTGNPLQDMSSIFAGVLINLANNSIGVLPAGPEGGLAVINNVTSPQFQTLQDFVYDSFDDQDLMGPKGYLAYMFFDEGMMLNPKYSGILPIGESDELVRLSRNGLKVPENGYLYVYVTNVSEQRVYFDNLSLKRWAPVVRQTYDYYPFGLLWESPSNAFQESEQHDNCYQSKEYIWKGFDNGKNPNLYDFHARMYDPAIGRWTTPDPAMQHFSPYLAMANNPTSFIDPTGTWTSASWENNGDGWVDPDKTDKSANKKLKWEKDVNTQEQAITKCGKNAVLYPTNQPYTAVDGTTIVLYEDGGWERLRKTSNLEKMDYVGSGGSGMESNGAGLGLATTQPELQQSKSGAIASGFEVVESHWDAAKIPVSEFSSDAAAFESLQWSNFNEQCALQFAYYYEMGELSEDIVWAYVSGAEFALSFGSISAGRSILQKAFFEAAEETAEKVVIRAVPEAISSAAKTSTSLLKPLGLGSTGRAVAGDLTEQLAMKEILSNPAMGRVIKTGLKDARWSGWSKMAWNNAGVEIHYVAKFENGVLKAVDDFKFIGGK